MNRSAERRQYKRFWVLQPATLKNSWAGLFQCEIHDFCPKGILVSLTGSSANLASIAQLQDQAVTIEFRPDPAGEDVYRLAGNVVRINQNSLGIAVENFPMNAFLDLTRIAKESASDNESISTNAFPQHQLDAAKISCHKQFHAFIKEAIQNFYETVDNKLTITSSNISDFTAIKFIQSLYPLLSSRRPEIEQAFLGASYLQQLFDQRPTSPDKQQSEKLSLVDIDDFEDWLNLSQVINELGFEHQSAIENFLIRFKVLVSKAATAHDNPYGPYFIFQTFRKAISDIKLSNPIRAVLYKAFFESLSRSFEEFYQGLNEAVAFVPSIRNAKIAAAQDRAMAQKTKDFDTAKNPGQQVHESDLESKPASTRHPAGAASDSDNEQREYQLDNLLQYLSNPKAEFKTPIDHSVFGGHPGWTDALANRANSLIPAMNSLFNAAHHTQEYNAGYGMQPSSSVNIIEGGANLKQILDVLDNVRLRQSSGAEQNGHISIKRRLTAELPQLDDSETSKDKHFQAIRLFDALVSKPLADDVLGSDIRSILKKLEVPLLKLALLDEKFLESDAHPARHTVNLFERYYVAADDFGKIFDPKLLKLLHQLANRVVDNYEINPAVFDEVNGILANLLKPVENVRKKNANRIQLISEGGEKIYLVRDQVEQEIRSSLGGKMVPKIIPFLLDAGWRHYLQLTSLRKGQDSTEHQRALTLLDDLLELLAPDVINAGIDAKKIQNLVTYISAKLKEILHNEDAIEEITQSLSKQLQGKQPIEFQFHGSDHVNTTSKNNPGDAEIHQIHMGDWLSFEQEGIQVPHQLVWSNISQTRFVFANRSATKKRHLEQHELHQAIQNGMAIKIPALDAPFMERSAHKVMLDAYERLYHQATHDPETGLLNRKGLINQIEKIIAAGVADNQSDILCLMMFDQLKAIYHSCDQNEAEASLLAIVESLSKEIQPIDLFSRLGEDTFAVLFRGRTLDKANSAAQNMVSLIKEHRITCQGKSFVLGVSAGIAELTAGMDSPSTLMQNAGSACVAAKSMGSNTVQRYENSNLHIRSEQALFEWAGIIDKALSEDLLYLRCQKIRPVLADSGALPHYEILLGLNDSLGIQPFDLIRAAERWKRSPDLDLWVLRNSFQWIRENATRLGALNGFSINLSGLSLVNENILDFIQDALDKNDLPTEKIIFEVTESAAIERLDAAQTFIDKIKAYGCRFSLDDFGSGYSSFAYLKGLKVNYLKIDGAFVRDMLKDPADYAMVKSMHEIGHSLGLLTIAEYVENDAILAKLKEIGIDYAQGYGIEKPMPLHQLLPI
ncbi:diguanylate cyclase/phosphodiesterase [Sulfuriferula multivorans]|uniref:Diguanylate cyclase/phosphodiesterase n=2 Tax=Sulfuriferula multivorans TaxID=1559896 RepID=A0A401JHY9_9PROT|nr:diguanylate cyclase/phosphodiesterase [Sulfuriferula multivorans]